jgi:hypothetical protein
MFCMTRLFPMIPSEVAKRFCHIVPLLGFCALKRAQVNLCLAYHEIARLCPPTTDRRSLRLQINDKRQKTDQSRKANSSVDSKPQTW